jgi:hypothetical protein
VTQPVLNTINSTILKASISLTSPATTLFTSIINSTVHNTCNGILASLNKEEVGQILVYPSPFSNQITFSYNEQATVSLYDFLGRQIIQQTFTNSTTINTEQLTSGIYFYRLKNYKGTLKTGKVVKQ